MILWFSVRVRSRVLKDFGDVYESPLVNIAFSRHFMISNFFLSILTFRSTKNSILVIFGSGQVTGSKGFWRFVRGSSGEYRILKTFYDQQIIFFRYWHSEVLKMMVLWFSVLVRSRVLKDFGDLYEGPLVNIGFWRHFMISKLLSTYIYIQKPSKWWFCNFRLWSRLGF